MAKTNEDKLLFWEAPSGRLHRQRTCSGSNRRTVKPVYRTPEELQAIWDQCLTDQRDPAYEICRCTRNFVPERNRA